MPAAVACAPCPISIQTHLADGVLAITTLRIVVEIIPDLEGFAFAAESSVCRRFLFVDPPTLRWSLITSKTAVLIF